MNGKIDRLDATGTATTIVSGEGIASCWEPQRLVVDADNVYFYDYFDDPPRVGVFEVPVSGPTSAVQKVAALDTIDGHRWSHIVVAGGVTYLAEYSGIAVANGGPSAEPQTWCDSTCSHGVQGLATDGATLFWSGDNPAGVYACAATGTECATSSTVATSSIKAPPSALAYDGERLFVETFKGDDGTARLYGCAPTACNKELTPIATAPAFAGTISVTADAVYWIADTGPTTDGGTTHASQVMRIAK